MTTISQVRHPAGPPNPGSAPSPGSAPNPGAPGNPTRAVVRAWWRDWRWAVLVAIVVGLAGLITAITVPRGDSVRLGPANPAPDGARAVVQVLRRQGVEIQLDDDSRRVVADTDNHSTLLITDPELLGTEQLNRLATDDVSNLVLVEPVTEALHRLAPQIQVVARTAGRTTDPGCTVPAAQTAGTALAGGFGYQLAVNAVDPDPAAVCYPLTGRPGVGSYLIEERPGRTITVIGQSDLLTNQYLGRNGNAALALTTLGSQPKLVWYSPNPLEPNSAAGQPSLTDLLPDWVLWVIVQLFVVILVVMLWRARRLGRLVSEPLPVVVRAAETQEGRARLYRQARARGRAAATLRTTTLRRLAGRLSAPPGTTPSDLVTLAATATGREAATLGSLLLGPAPLSDDALIALADQLDAVEHDLTRMIDPRGPLL